MMDAAWMIEVLWPECVLSKAQVESEIPSAACWEVGPHGSWLGSEGAVNR